MLGQEGLMSSLRHHLATSDAGYARAVRQTHKRILAFSVPAPRSVAKVALWGYVAARGAYHFGKRVLVIQPLFEAYCERCGPGLRTGIFLHWVQGNGDIVLGEQVWLDGKSTFTFAASFSERPTLEIGDGTTIGHATEIVVGKRVTIGKNCQISGSTRIIDSNGHPSAPDERRAGKPPSPDKVRPVSIGDDVWIGKHCVILPGVRIGNGAIVSSGSVVRDSVPAYAIVAGNPARVVHTLPSSERTPSAVNGV